MDKEAAKPTPKEVKEPTPKSGQKLPKPGFSRKEKLAVTIYLLSGVKLTGRIRSFDKFSVVLESNSQEQLIFKHAISTVVTFRSAHAAIAGAPSNAGAAAGNAPGRPGSDNRET